jgi:hypothetical protein
MKMFVKGLQPGLKHERHHKAFHSLFNATETVRLRWTTNQNVLNIRGCKPTESVPDGGVTGVADSQSS